jgi:hypothetical protein
MGDINGFILLPGEVRTKRERDKSQVISQHACPEAKKPFILRYRRMSGQDFRLGIESL